MKLGFTGSREGMTLYQKSMLASWLGVWLATQDVDEVHHGCCVGADDEFHQICRWFGLRAILHPPDSKSLVVSQHFLDVPDSDVWPAAPYLVRNKIIVDKCDFLVAAPATIEEVQRSGTWAAIRYARRVHKEHRLIVPVK